MQPPKRTIHHILLIDDDEDDYLLMSEAIKSISPDLKLSYTPDCAKDFSMFPWLQPDLIFLDLNMPKQDGYACLRQLKQGSLSSVPVVMFSTTKSQNSVTKAFEAGASLFLSKPYSFHSLVSSLKGVLELDWKDPALIASKWYYGGEFHPFTMGNE